VKKNIYFAKGNEGLGSGWLRRWRRHGALAMSLPLWKAINKYSQCDSLPARPSFAADHGYRGIGIVWFNRQAGLADLDDPRGAEILMADELEVFGEFVGNFSLITEETVIREAYDAPIKLLLAVEKRTDVTPARTHEYGQCLAREFSSLRRVAVNDAIVDEYTTNSCIDLAAVIEMSVADIETAGAVVTSPLFEQLSANYIGLNNKQARIIVTRENMFFDMATGCNEGPRLIDEYLTSTS
jgi:hypothetical protein